MCIISDRNPSQERSTVKKLVGIIVSCFAFSSAGHASSGNGSPSCEAPPNGTDSAKLVVEAHDAAVNAYIQEHFGDLAALEFNNWLKNNIEESTSLSSAKGERDAVLSQQGF